MLGRGHAISGVTLWLTGCAAASVLGHPPGPDTIIVGAGVCAGAALVPDFDHPEARISNSGGLLTRGVSHAFAWFGARVHAATKLDADRPDLDGHRTVSHTWIFGVILGLFVSWLAGGLGADLLAAMVGVVPQLGPAANDALGDRYNAVVVALIVFFFTKIGVEAAMSLVAGKHRRVRLLGRRRSWSSVLAWSFAAVAFVLVPGETWWLGLAVGAGSVIHTLGDMITMGRCPVLWPIPLPRREWRRVAVGGRRGERRQVLVWRSWYPVGPPHPFRFRVGSPAEDVVTWMLVALGISAAGALLYLAW